ncbi:MAG: hypothetical protein FJX67_03580 [Alphaproteobacteria bacterium]|nr:hypothetical protein [Alphaproteobacteria bacterium]
MVGGIHGAALAAALLAGLASITAHAARDLVEMAVPALPATVREALQRDAAGWTIPTAIDREGWAFCGPPRRGASDRHPYLVTADFDGDGRLDHAVYLVRAAGGQTLHRTDVVLASGRVVSIEAPLRVSSAEPMYFLDVTPKGTTIVPGGGRRVTLLTDALGLVRCEAARQSHVWEPRTKRFRVHQTAD